MNEYARILINSKGHYSIVDENSWKIFVLSNFFIRDVNGLLRFKYWIDSLNEPNDALFGAGGDWASLEKDENGYVTMIDTTTWRTYEDKPIPEELILRIKPVELIKLLYKWEELYAKKVPAIMITKDGDSFEMFEIKLQAE